MVGQAYRNNTTPRDIAVIRKSIESRTRTTLVAIVVVGGMESVLPGDYLVSYLVSYG